MFRESLSPTAEVLAIVVVLGIVYTLARAEASIIRWVSSTPCGQERLRLAISEDDVPAARQALAEGARANQVDDTGHTPLFWAAAYGRYEIVRELLLNGANPRFVDPYGVSPLGIARFQRQDRVCELLHLAGL